MFYYYRVTDDKKCKQNKGIINNVYIIDLPIIGRASGVPVLSSLLGRERAAPRCAFLSNVGVGVRVKLVS